MLKLLSIWKINNFLQARATLLQWTPFVCKFKHLRNVLFTDTEEWLSPAWKVVWCMRTGTAFQRHDGQGFFEISHVKWQLLLITGLLSLLQLINKDPHAIRGWYSVSKLYFWRSQTLRCFGATCCVALALVLWQQSAQHYRNVLLMKLQGNMLCVMLFLCA